VPVFEGGTGFTAPRGGKGSARRSGGNKSAVAQRGGGGGGSDHFREKKKEKKGRLVCAPPGGRPSLGRLPRRQKRGQTTFGGKWDEREAFHYQKQQVQLSDGKEKMHYFPREKKKTMANYFPQVGGGGPGLSCRVPFSREGEGFPIRGKKEKEHMLRAGKDK